MFSYTCANGHISKELEDRLIICKECGQFKSLFWADECGGAMWGIFECNAESKSTPPGIEMPSELIKGAGNCGFLYMSKKSDYALCPMCSQMNRAHAYVNDDRAEREQKLKESEALPEGYGQPERVTHFRMLGGKEVAVTNKGKIKEKKDTEFANDPKGKKRAGYVNSWGGETKKAKATAHRGDYK